MPGIVKIGFTKGIERRLRDLDTTGALQSYEPHFSVKTKKYQLLKKLIHYELDKLADSHLRNNCEFFIDGSRRGSRFTLNVSQLLDDAEIGDYGNETAEDIISDGSKVYLMSSRTIFKILGIPVETMLEPITAEYNYPVVEMIDNENQGRILENYEVEAISRVAMDVANKPKNGLACCKYNGKTLTSVRKGINSNYLPSRHR